MDTIEKKLYDGLIGITVYSPDVYHSGISEDIDRHIEEATGLIPVFRHMFIHTSESIERFYETGVYKNVPNWHYVVDFFQSGPSLLTFWYGQDAIQKLNQIKGKSHPAKAERHTIRGRFFCDNAICNLIHTSDDIGELIRELNAVEVYGLLKKYFTPISTDSSFFSTGKRELKHNGAYFFYRLLTKLCNEKDDLELSQYNDSTSLYRELISRIESLGKVSKDSVRKMVKAFLYGDEYIRYELDNYDIAEEEKFMIICSTATRSGWEKQVSIREAVRSLVDKISVYEEVIVGGSTAARLHGYKCIPGDIDIICSEKSLRKIADRFALTICEKKAEFGTYLYCEYSFMGYEVEFSTMANYVNNYCIILDLQMLRKAAGWLPLMPVEDLIIELYSLNRTDYHADAVRAQKYYQYFKCSIDDEYLKERFKLSGLGIEKYNELIGACN